MELLRSMTENLNPGAYRPSDSEREVLSLVVQSDTPNMAYAQASDGESLVTARDKLIRLGFLIYNDGGIELSPTGDELVTAQAIEDNPEMPMDSE
ncbi:MAG: hypothetical protein JXR12_15240 [Neptunomonas phycophila]|uniref:hypothetical protein n=1 Tax=Neptunomonas phycophila TaxID=1572645 RepID=UPI003B8BC944